MLTVAKILSDLSELCEKLVHSNNVQPWISQIDLYYQGAVTLIISK